MIEASLVSTLLAAGAPNTLGLTEGPTGAMLAEDKKKAGRYSVSDKEGKKMGVRHDPLKMPKIKSMRMCTPIG